ncbi:hypothetical protein FRACYDRAFT_236561 [Fragilariopsis cylindrus CCMP1102]|uniref:Uncharacterized protein n=1 Tax=Fragilariopsis cylindrus CCMP1102 TaxID=635003 RepID=A0A1E7FJS4_9STRA|nr:hypothetical protein FRACYDRAFT_236561 [Fragilariopsis cylindrus CCMP1102]|eukprot:OEU18285.1 hypothetical protein FRACYDRAFT_236561 [Fragilariopsis cylindrus CCMP1102]
MKYHETMKESELLLSSSIIISTDLLHVALESSGGPNYDTRRHYNNENDPNRIFPFDSVMLSPIDVSASSDIVQYLCFSCPDAIDIDCTLVVEDGNEYDISTLALSIGGQISSNNSDNEKRDLILRGSDFYKQKFNIISTTAARATTLSKIDDDITDKIKVIVQEQLPPPDNSAIEKALRTVANYGEWQAVQNILPLLTYSSSNRNNDDKNEKENNKEKEQQPELEPEPEPLWVTEIRNEMEDYFRKKKRIKETDRKRRNYFGVVMYNVDIIVDLISTVIPKRRKRRKNNKRNNNNNNKNNSRSHALDQRCRNDHGESDGESDGVEVGESDGDELGESDGESDGDELGESDGESDGDELGESDGESDGDELGESNGESDGVELVYAAGQYS